MIKRLTSADVDFYLEHVERHMAESNAKLVFHPMPPEHSYRSPTRKKNVLLSWALTTKNPSWERAWGVWHKGKVVAHVTLRGSPVEASLHRTDLGIGVEEAFRSQGWGRKLMNTALQEAKLLELVWVDLRVFKNNRAALKLYRTLDFKKNGSISDLFRVHGQNIEDILMTLKLR